MIKFDLQLFGGLFGGGGGETQIVEKPVPQQSAPISSAVQTQSGTGSEKADSKKKQWGANTRGRASTVTGAGNNALTAASSIAKTLLGETPQRKTLGGA